MAPIIVYSKEYSGKFVARRGTEIIDYDADLERLLEKLKKRGINPRDVVVDYIPEEDVVLIV